MYVRPRVFFLCASPRVLSVFVYLRASYFVVGCFTPGLFVFVSELSFLYALPCVLCVFATSGGSQPGGHGRAQGTQGANGCPQILAAVAEPKSLPTRPVPLKLRLYEEKHLLRVQI